MGHRSDRRKHDTLPPPPPASTHKRRAAGSPSDRISIPVNRSRRNTPASDNPFMACFGCPGLRFSRFASLSRAAAKAAGAELRQFGASPPAPTGPPERPSANSARCASSTAARPTAARPSSARPTATPPPTAAAARPATRPAAPPSTARWTRATAPPCRRGGGATASGVIRKTDVRGIRPAERAPVEQTPGPAWDVQCTTRRDRVTEPCDGTARRAEAGAERPRRSGVGRVSRSS